MQPTYCWIWGFLSGMSLVLLVLAHCNDTFLGNSCQHLEQDIWIDVNTGAAVLEELLSPADPGAGHQMLLTEDNTKITTRVV